VSAIKERLFAQRRKESKERKGIQNSLCHFAFFAALREKLAGLYEKGWIY
jgi:hypothetical protein